MCVINIVQPIEVDAAEVFESGQWQAPPAPPQTPPVLRFFAQGAVGVGDRRWRYFHRHRFFSPSGALPVSAEVTRWKKAR